MEIVKAPNPILSQKAKPLAVVQTKIQKVVKLDKSIVKLIEEMKQTLAAAKDPEGVGLAASQVGKSLQIFIAKPTKSKVFTFINPVIEYANGQRVTRAGEYQDPGAGRQQNFRWSHYGLSAYEKNQLFPSAIQENFRCRPQRQLDIERQDALHRKNPIKLEGCLSLPTIWGTVKRFETIVLSYLDEQGKSHTRKFSGFLATIIQHEYDHLQGTLFPKRVLEQKGKLYKSKKDEKGKDIFEEIEI